MSCRREESRQGDKPQGPVLIIIEGGDRVGKGKQFELLVAALRRDGYPVWPTCEPTDGRIGREIRDRLNGVLPMLPALELQRLFTQDRAAHAKELRKRLQDGFVVVCDRYYPSTLAYYAASEEATAEGIDELWRANNLFPLPDLVLWLNLDPKVAMTRGRGRPDIHDKDAALQQRLREQYRLLMKRLPQIRKIDASGSPEEVHRRIMREVARLLG